MKIGQIIAIAFGLLIVAAGFVASSSENRESIGASWRRFTDDPVHMRQWCVKVD